MNGTHVRSGEMTDLQFCRCCLSTDAKELSSGNSYGHILSILTGNKLERAEILLWLCYRCSHTMRRISNFRDMCLHAETALNEYSSKHFGKREVKMHFIQQEKNRLNVHIEPSTSNTLCINITGQGTISPVQVISIVKGSRPQKNFTKDVHWDTKFRLEKELDLNLLNEPSITKSMKCQTDSNYISNNIMDNLNGKRFVPVEFSDSFMALEDDIDKEEELPIETLKKKIIISEESLEVCKKKIKLKTCTKRIFRSNCAVDKNKRDPNINEIDQVKSKRDTVKRKKAPNKKGTLKKEKYPNMKVTLKKEKDPNKKITPKKEKDPILNPELPVMSEVEEAVCTSLTIEEQIKEKEDRAKEDYFVNSVFKCELCVKIFKAKHVLNGHMEKHKESYGSYVCCVCTQRFCSEKNLRRHSRLHSRHYECPICSKRCWPKPAFREHVARHKGVANKCPVCGKCFTGRLTHLRTHIRVAHGTGPRYKCDTCGKIYDDRYLFKLHIFRHSGAPTHQCPECPKSFYTLKILTLHMKKHSASKEYYCVECDRHFPWHSSFLGHLKTSPAHRDPTLRFDCAHCSLHFTSLPRLQTHLRKHHEGAPSPGGENHTCEQCGRTFNSKSNLYSHTKFRHEGFKLPRKFACTMCEKVFSAKPSLRDHIYTHTGERPFECHVCHYKFTQKSAMNTHIKKMHSGDGTKPAAKRCYRRVDKGGDEKTE